MKTRKRKYSSAKTPRFGRRQLIALSLAALAVIALGLVLTRSSSTDKPKNQTTATAASSKGEQPAQGSSTTVPGNDKTQGGGSTTNVTPSGEAPKTPYGNFVSSHIIGSNDSEFSTCLTSVGAKCKITFTNNGVTKALEEKTTDSDGAAYWSWKPQGLGLTAGSWQITATSTLNGKTASTTDGRNLVVQP